MPTVSSSLPDPVLETQVFWERYKKEVVAVILIVVLALAGYGGYRLYSEYRNKSAAAMLASARTGPDFQKVITQYSGTPASASAYIFLANEQRKETQFAEANATLQAFIARNPKHELTGTARMAMAANLEALGKRDEALTMYQRLAAESPTAFTAPIALIFTVPLLKEKNQIEEARRVCETILTQYRDSVIAMEATQQLKSLKVPESAPAPPPSAAMAATPAPVVSAAPASTPVPTATPAATATPQKPQSRKRSSRRAPSP